MTGSTAKSRCRTIYFWQTFPGNLWLTLRVVVRNLLRGSARRNFVHISYYVHTYIHSWPLQSFSLDYNLVSHTTYVVCVNFVYEARNLHFEVDYKRQIFFEKSYLSCMAIIFPLQSFCQKKVAGEIFYYTSL